MNHEHLELKPIPDFEGYCADRNGGIWSCLSTGNRKKFNNTYHRLHPGIDRRGGKTQYYLRKGNRSHNFNGGNLVLKAFVGIPPRGMQCCHGILGGTIDCLENLKWGTAKENWADKFRDGTAVFGEKHSRHKLNELQVRIIRRSATRYGRNGISYKDLASIFGVSDLAVGLIMRGHNWKQCQCGVSK